MGIVPYGSGDEIGRQPIGSGPFRFVSAEQDKEVVIARNDDYWGEKARLSKVRFIVVPDTTTRALELRKGSADIAINALTSDMVLTLERDPESRRPARSRHRAGLYGVQSARSYSQGRARPAGPGLCHRPPPSAGISATRFCPAGQQRSAAGELGLQRRRACLRPRSRPRPPVARAGGISGGERRALSSHHENVHRREHAADGGGAAAATAPGGNRTRYSHLRICDFLFRRDPRPVPGLFPALDRRQRRSRTSSNTSSTPPSFLPTAPTAATSPIRGWMR